jgi:hypothetical protein
MYGLYRPDSVSGEWSLVCAKSEHIEAKLIFFQVILRTLSLPGGGKRSCSRLRHYAPCSSPNEVIEFFNLHNPSNYSMVLGFTEVITRKCFWGVECGGPMRLTTTLPSVSRLS